MRVHTETQTALATRSATGAKTLPAAAQQVALILDPEAGLWRSPGLLLQPGGYYLARFRYAAPRPVLFGLRFYGAGGQELEADNYDELPPTIGPGPEEYAFLFCARPRARATHVQVDAIALEPGNPPQLEVSELTRAEAARELEQALAALPALLAEDFLAPGMEAVNSSALAQTANRLRRGEELRLVLVGDSIANDTGNSHFALLLERALTGSVVNVISEVSGAKGCEFYLDKDRFKSRLLVHQPHLVLVAGISHNCHAEPVFALVAAVKAALPQAEFLVTTGGMADPGMTEELRGQGMTSVPEAGSHPEWNRLHAFHATLAAGAQSSGFAFLDTRSVWEAYVRRTGLNRYSFMRDPVHANVHGKAILGATLVQFLASQAPQN